jgi:hypothetical protein
VLALVFAGCADSGPRPLPTQPAGEPGFVADSPANAVRLFEWALEHRDLERLKGLLTDDFLFGCAATDSAGNAFQGRAVTRTDEIECILHMLVGGGTHPPASSIDLQFDQNLFAEPDSRPGKDPATHREIITSMVLRIETSEEDFQVTGQARFFLVRGDVAFFPAELAERGGKPDPGLWYLERWEDETVGSAGAAAQVLDGRRASSLEAQPAKMTTWCAIKALYR